MCDDRTQYRNSRAITIAAIDMLVSCSVGAVTYRRGERFDNLVYCPHRFARMFHCDQHIPNFLMIAAQGTRSLDFICYLHNNSREESQQLLQRRHLSFHRPKFTHFMSNLSHGGVVAHWIISSGAQKLLTSCEIQAHSGLAPEAQSRSGLHLTHMSKVSALFFII